MITDGKPTCLKIGGKYYKNSFGLDRKVVNRCINLCSTMQKNKNTHYNIYDCKRPLFTKFCTRVYRNELFKLLCDFGKFVKPNSLIVLKVENENRLN
jgi:uncharacterized protein with von Willebrand factor type A (vWA) domain